MQLFFIIVSICIIIYSAQSIKDEYNAEAQAARDKYFEINRKDFKHYRISEEHVKQMLEDNQQKDHRLLINFAVTAGILAIVLSIICAMLINEKSEFTVSVVSTMFIVAWGFLTSIIAVINVQNGVEEKIHKELEEYRCPHCNAPLSYFHTDHYEDGDFYYQKKVQKGKFEGDRYYTYIETQNWRKYKVHDIYTCNYCQKRDHNVTEKEERLDG